MLIPSIDLMGGRIVQLVGGERKALEFDDFEPWLARFRDYPLVQVIDLDAAMRAGNNRAQVAAICGRLPCQVGGGVATPELAHELANAGARRVIVGSALVRGGAVDLAAAERFAHAIGRERLIAAIDARAGKVAIAGWRERTELDPVAMMQQLGPYCAGFLYTHIDTEGQMTGFPFEVAQRLRVATTRELIVAGGIASMDEVRALADINVDAVVGMALYTGAIA
jgi:phosphoribosylformimino-5-aminoimidazole carboxamide ribotide isomerase